MAVGSLADIRHALAALLAPVVDGRAYPSMLDAVPVSQAAVLLVIDQGDTVIERLALDGGYSYALRVRVIVGGLSDTERQNTLDRLISPGEPGSLWQTLEAPGALVGVVDDVTVTGVTNYGAYADGDDTTAYMAADLLVTVYQT